MPIWTPERGIEVAPVIQSRGQGAAAQADALNSLARGAAGVAERADFVQRQSANVYASKAISDAKAEWTKTTLDRQMAAEGDASGYAKGIAEDFRKYANEAVAMAPALARDKLEVAFNDYANQLEANALSFEATKRVAYRSDMLGATIDQNRNTVLSDPSQFEDLLADTLDAIDGMGLPQEKATDLERMAREGMGRSAMDALIERDPGAAYSALVKGEWDRYLDPEDKGRFMSVAKAAADAEYVRREAGFLSEEMSGTWFGGAVSLLKDFEGFSDKTYWDVNAHRLGYGSDTKTLEHGQVVRVKEGDYVTRQDADRDLARRAKEEAAQARETVGPAWDVLPESAKSALVSVAYNYGSLPDEVVAAIRTGDTLAIADAVEGLKGHNKGINAKRRQREADIIRHSDSRAVLDAALGEIEDPVLRDKVEREALARYALGEQARARQEAADDLAREQRIAALEVKLDRGEASYGDIEEAYSAGDLSPDQWSVLTRRKDAAIEAAKKETKALNDAVSMVESGDLNPFSPEARKAVNLVYENSDRTPEAGVALAAATGVAPAEFMATIKQGLMSGDAEAFSRASMLQDVAPLVYANDADVKAKVEEFRAFTGLGYSPDDAVRRINRTPQEKKAFEVLDPQISKELREIDVSDASGAFNGLVFDADVSELMSPGLMADFRAIYAEERRDGLGPSEAKAVAQQKLTRTWGPSSVSGSEQIVRHPAERYYQMTPETIAKQATKDIEAAGLAAQRVELVADYVTESDIRAGKPPRYRLYYTDEDGAAQAMPGHFQPVMDNSDRKALYDAARVKALRANEIRQNVDEQVMP